MAISKEKKFETVDAEGAKITLVCIRPNQDVLDGAKLEYNVVFAKALRAGCLMRAEAEDIIEKRKLWSDEHESKLKTMKIDLHKLELQLKNEADIDVGKKIAQDMAALRAKMNELVMKRNDLYNRTAEWLAESAQNHYLIVRCILHENREPYFSSLEKFKLLENSQLLSDCLGELMLFLMDVTVEELNNTPENAWLIDKKLIDPKTGFWLSPEGLKDDLGRLVDENGNLLKTEIVPKTTEINETTETTETVTKDIAGVQNEKSETT